MFQGLMVYRCFVSEIYVHLSMSQLSQLFMILGNNPRLFNHLLIQTNIL